MSGRPAPCPALLLGAPASGQGKTTIAAGLARYYRQQGLNVRVFKTGPDFLDPMVLEKASGQPVYVLDPWMMGAQQCAALLYAAAQFADVILVESAMGLFDGASSGAAIAHQFQIPILAVINAQGMAQSFGAIAYGLAHYQTGLPFAGVLANRVASAAHGEQLAAAMPPGLRYYGGVPRAGAISLPDRHLGLVQAVEVDDLDARLDQAAHHIAQTALAQGLPPTVTFMPARNPHVPPLLKGQRIGIACDAAFSFLYPTNVDTLHALGAETVFFSPLADQTLPPVDSIYLPGGYPELHLHTLAENAPMREALVRHHQSGKPIYAECGGLLYTVESLTDKTGDRANMLGLMPGHAVLQPRLTGLGMQAVQFPQGLLRGHTFHYSQLETSCTPWCVAYKARDRQPGEAVYRSGSLTATYLHLYFGSDPVATAALFLASHTSR